MTPPAVRHPGEARWETRLLALTTAILLAFGIAATYSAASFGRSGGVGLLRNQVIGALVGGLAMLAVSRVDYQRWRALAWPLLLATIVALLLVILPFTRAIAPMKNGARRWIELGPLNFQPSEVARVVVVIWCAALAAKKGDQVRDFKKGTLPFLVVVGLVAALILKQPNMSMATLLLLLCAVILFTAGARIGHFLLLATVLGIGAWQAIRLAPYRFARVKAFLDTLTDPGGAADKTTFQIKQSIIGIGSGGFLGRGFGEGQQKAFLPYAYSDFLFSAIGEEWGFVGVLLVVALFGIFTWVGFRIARTAPDTFGQCLAVGLTCAISLTAFMHMAVSLGLMPTTGLTLPFMSYGRSSQVISLAGTGILIAIGQARGRPARG